MQTFPWVMLIAPPFTNCSSHRAFLQWLLRMAGSKVQYIKSRQAICGKEEVHALPTRPQQKASAPASAGLRENQQASRPKSQIDAETIWRARGRSSRVGLFLECVYFLGPEKSASTLQSSHFLKTVWRKAVLLPRHCLVWVSSQFGKTRTAQNRIHF